MTHPFNRLSWTASPSHPTEANPPSEAAIRETVAAAIARELPLFSTPAPTWTPDSGLDRTPDPPQVASVDWAVVRDLQTTAADKVSEAAARYEADHGRAPDYATEVPAMAKPIIDEVVQRWVTMSELAGTHRGQDLGETTQLYVKAVRDSLYGLGRMQPLLEIPDAENVIISGAQPVVVEHNDGRRTRLPPVADSSADLMQQLQHMAQSSVPRRAFDGSHLDMTLMVRDQFRIHAVSDEISREPSVVIRQHLMTRVSLGDLADKVLMPIEVAEFLDQAVQAGLTIVVAGEQGVGKTTLLRALIHAIPIQERFATLETDLELFAHKMPGREHTLVMFARDGMGEKDDHGRRSGEVEVSDMVRPALRQGLGRIIIGEVRGVEASAMFQAMQSGTGTMSSIHSPNPEQVPIRLADVVAQGRIYNIEEAQRQVGLSVDLIIYIRRRDTNGVRHRFIESITQVAPGERDGVPGMPAMTPLYLADTWTGTTLSFTTGELGGSLTHLRRNLDRLGDTTGEEMTS